MPERRFWRLDASEMTNLDAYFATVREIKPMELMNLGDHDISDDTLKATGFRAI
jgi:hypothetical protein